MSGTSRLSPGSNTVESVNDSSGTTTIQGTDGSDTRTVAVDSNGRIRLATSVEADIGDVNLLDVDDNQIDPAIQYPDLTDTDSGTGSGNAAEIDLEGKGGRTGFDVHFDTTGGATLNVEVSKNGTDWRPLDTESVSSATQDINQYGTRYRYVRAYLNQNRNLVELSAKGE